MSEPLKRWDQPVSLTIELVFTGSGEVMSSRELAHMMFHELRGQQWKLYPEGDGGQPSVVELKVARPLCEGEGCEWHGG